jgi:hypothetical protein
VTNVVHDSRPLSPWSGVRPESGFLRALWEYLGDPAAFQHEIVLLTGADKLASGAIGAVGLLLAAVLALGSSELAAIIAGVVAAAILVNMFTYAAINRAKAANTFAAQGYLATLEGFEAIDKHTLWLFLPVGYQSRPWAISVAQAMADQLDQRAISKRVESRLFGYSTTTDVVRGLVDGPALIGFATRGRITGVTGYTGRRGEHQSVWAVVPLTRSKAITFRIRPRLVRQLLTETAEVQRDE